MDDFFTGGAVFVEAMEDLRIVSCCLSLLPTYGSLPPGVADVLVFKAFHFLAD